MTWHAAHREEEAKVDVSTVSESGFVQWDPKKNQNEANGTESRRREGKRCSILRGQVGKGH